LAKLNDLSMIKNRKKMQVSEKNPQNKEWSTAASKIMQNEWF
jgi:hypothetical protein